MVYDALAIASQCDDDDDDLGANDMGELKTTAEAACRVGRSPGYLSNLRCWGDRAEVGQGRGARRAIRDR